MDGASAVELTTFTSVGDAYIYAPLPAATSYGHRAENWNPDKWLQEVKVKVVTAGNHCFMRMLTTDTGELFAECPLPADGTPLTTAVEPVVDSSRYFVAKVVDRESRNHAFVGVGFRDRMDASDFTAALDDYRQYLRRKQEAEQMRQEFDTLQVEGTSSNSSSGQGGQQGADSAAAVQFGGSAAQKDFSLKPGETLHIKLSPSLKRGDSGKKASAAAGGAAASILRSGSGGSSGPDSSSVPAVVPRLAPPSSSSSSSSGFFRLHPPSPPHGVNAAPEVPSTAAAAAAAAAALPQGSSISGSIQQDHGASGAAVSPAAVQDRQAPGRPSLDASSHSTAISATGQTTGEIPAAVVAEDDWGDFVG